MILTILFRGDSSLLSRQLQC